MQKNWSWRFDTSLLLSNVTIDEVNYNTMSGVNTRDSNWQTNGNNFMRVFTWKWGGHANIDGFSYELRSMLEQIARPTFYGKTLQNFILFHIQRSISGNNDIFFISTQARKINLILN